MRAPTPREPASPQDASNGSRGTTARERPPRATAAREGVPSAHARSRRTHGGARARAAGCRCGPSSPAAAGTRRAGTRRRSSYAASCYVSFSALCTVTGLDPARVKTTISVAFTALRGLRTLRLKDRFSFSFSLPPGGVQFALPAPTVTSCWPRLTLILSFFATLRDRLRVALALDAWLHLSDSETPFFASFLRLSLLPLIAPSDAVNVGGPAFGHPSGETPPFLVGHLSAE